MKAQIFNDKFWVKGTDPETLKEKYLLMLYDAGFSVIDKMEYHFDPYGYTLLVLLAESHFAIHTFPEENLSYIELSSCTEKPFKKFQYGIRQK